MATKPKVNKINNRTRAQSQAILAGRRGHSGSINTGGSAGAKPRSAAAIKATLAATRAAAAAKKAKISTVKKKKAMGPKKKK